MRNSLNDEFGDIDGEEDDLPFQEVGRCQWIMKILN